MNNPCPMTDAAEQSATLRVPAPSAPVSATPRCDHEAYSAYEVTRDFGGNTSVMLTSTVEEIERELAEAKRDRDKARAQTSKVAKALAWEPPYQDGLHVRVENLISRAESAEARAAELQKACQEMNSALSRCAYLSGPPNEQEVSWYDVEPYPQSAVDAVKKMADKLAAETARADGAHNAAIDKCIAAIPLYGHVDSGDPYDQGFAQCREESTDAILALKVPQ